MRGPAPGRSRGLGSSLVGKLLIGAAGVVLAGVSMATALVNATHYSKPEAALAIDARDPVALAARADELIAEGGVDSVASPKIVALAQSSLAGQALNSDALRLIGLARSVSDPKAAAKAFEVGDKLGRRDLTTQLWLVESSVQRQDVAGALRHYDTALRTREESQQVLFPVLTKAVENATLWAAIVPYVREPAPWLADWARFAVRNSTQPGQIAGMFTRAGGMPKRPEYAALELELLRRLVTEDYIRDAIAYHRRLPGADPATLRTAGFTSSTTDARFPPLTWELFPQSGATLGFEQAETGNRIQLNVRLDPGTSGLVARKVLTVAPGRYRFRADQSLTTGAGAATAHWQIRCGARFDQRLVWGADVALESAVKTTEGEIDIPADCPAISIELQAAAPPSGNGSELLFASPSFDKIG